MSRWAGYDQGMEVLYMYDRAPRYDPLLDIGMTV